MSTEEWRRVPDFPRYYVSSTGRVVSYRRGNRRELRPSVNAYGYKVVGLTNAAHNSPKLFVHRLVLTAFVGPCPDGMEGCHNDGDRTNNSVENLRWDTRAGNMQDAIAHGTHPQAGKKSCKYNHPFDDENTVVQGDGSRRCRACHARRSREYRERTARAAA